MGMRAVASRSFIVWPWYYQVGDSCNPLSAEIEKGNAFRDFLTIHLRPCVNCSADSGASRAIRNAIAKSSSRLFTPFINQGPVWRLCTLADLPASFGFADCRLIVKLTSVPPSSSHREPRIMSFGPNSLTEIRILRSWPVSAFSRIDRSEVRRMVNERKQRECAK